MIVSKESRKTIATARMPTSATRICISLASNPDREKKIHQAGRGFQSGSAVAAPHVMKMARFVSALFVVAVGVTACGGGAASGVTLGKKIAFLLPDSQSSRYETRDAPIFEAKIKGMCSDCTVDYRNAHGNAPAQLPQPKTALPDSTHQPIPYPAYSSTTPSTL